MHRSNRSAAEQEVRCGGAGGRGARGSTAPGGLGLGFQGVRVPLFVGRRNGLGVRAGRGARRDSWAAGVRGRRKRREEALTGGAREPEKERGGARLGLADGRRRVADGAGLGRCRGGAADVEVGVSRWEADWRPLEVGRGRCGPSEGNRP
jgi:hypothetical protein